MKSRLERCTSLLVLLLLSSAPARAELAVRYVFPAVANTVGANGATFRTAIRMRSADHSPMTLLLRLATPDGPLQTKDLVFAPGIDYSSDNLLEDVFGYSGGGALEITESTASIPFLVTAYVYVDGPSGRVTTPLSGLRTADRLPNFPSWSLSHGLSSDTLRRASFGCANFDSAAAKVLVNAIGSGSPYPEPQIAILDLPPGAWKQLPVSVYGDDLFLVFQLIGESATLGTYCYGVTTSNSLNDGLAVPAEPIPLRQ